MADITMCQNDECPSKDKCYRFTATPARLQGYSAFEPLGNERCDEFWPNQSADEDPQGSAS